MTLARGLAEMRLSRIHLIVRKNNPRAIRLYRRLGFTECGECVKTVDGRQTSFLNMERQGTPLALNKLAQLIGT